MLYISSMKNTKTNTETLLEQSVIGMLKSKVDIETSDIFFNYGAKTYLAQCAESNKRGYFFDGDYYLRRDAEAFLEIVDRPDITPQDLVDDFNHRT